MHPKSSRPRKSSPALSVSAFVVLMSGLLASPTYAQLNEHCTVSILNRTAQVRPDGSWRIDNIPAGFGPVRARGTCVEDGVTRSGESEPFTIVPGRMNPIPPIVLGPTTPIPTSLRVTAALSTLTQVGQTTQLTVTATYAGGSTKDITLGSSGTSYSTTNAGIASVGGGGVVNAVRSGTVIIRATNEGTAGLLAIKVQLTGDSDDDGIPDDIELAEGLNPNNPVDALEDADRDGLSNLAEFDRGTQIRVADSDGDGISDGEEVVAGVDGFITNPLLADSDGDGVRDALEISVGSDPNDSASVNLAAALESLSVAPSTFTITINSIQGIGSQQLAVTGRLRDGTSIDLTSTLRGTNYSSSDLNVCNFGQPDGRVFGAQSGPCTITIASNGFQTQATGSVINFSPTSLSSLAIPGYANNVDANGAYAYVSAGAAGLVIVSVGNPSAPVIVATVDTPGNANDVRVVGNLAYVADGASGLQIVDVSNPAAPVLLGTLDTPGEANDVFVSGNVAYVADGQTGLQIIDVSNPAAPALIRGVDTPGIARGVDVEGSTVVVADDSPALGLRVVDVTTPASASIVGNIGLSGEIIDVDLSEGFAYVAAYTGGVHVVDVRVPTAPLLIGGLPGSAPNGFVPRDVQVAGQFALFAEQLFANAVAPVVDISSPSAPLLRTVLDFGQDFAGTGIAISGPYVFWTGQSFVVSSENGTTGNTRLFIGQYISQEDRGGIAPTVTITQPSGSPTEIEGTTVTVRATATDDVAVSSVSFLVNGQVAFVDTSEPFEARLVAPSAPGPMVLGASAVDFGGNIGTAAPVTVNVIPDPLTTVSGRVIDETSLPVAGAEVVVDALTTTSNGDGTFALPDVPTVKGNIVVQATAVVGGNTVRGISSPAPPVRGGVTAVGDIVVRQQAATVEIVPTAVQGVANCIPFGDNVSFNFTGFIYRNVPAFQLVTGGRLSFDLGAMNDVDIRRNIYLAVASANPSPGGVSQNIRALGWTKIVSETQTPQNPRGDSVVGNFELTYTAEAPFVFPGGGLIVGFGGTPPGTYSDSGCDQVLAHTSSSDPSGFFHRRFYFKSDQTLDVLDDGSSDTSWLGGVIIAPTP